MVVCPKSTPQDQKRKYLEEDVPQDDASLPSKKFKSTKEHHSASNFSPEFYDSLSKVWLTRRALRELDRRNQLKGGICAQILAYKPARQLSNQKDLQRLARLGGPELGDLRGYPEPSNVNLEYTMSSKRSSCYSGQSKSSKSTTSSTSEITTTEGSRKRSSAYDADFEQHLIDNGIYPQAYEYPDSRETPEPDNLEAIRQRLVQSRPSLSPSNFPDSKFRKFDQANARVISESKVMNQILPTICGDSDIPNEENLLFTRLESITNETTVGAQPDFYDGARLESLEEQVREDLGPYIIPTGHRTTPVLPNFFLEVKAPRGGADVGKRQITYDMSLGARGMHQLQSYAMEVPVFDNKAYTLGATYHAGTGTLQMYATHVTPTGPGGSLEYHATKIRAECITGSLDQFLHGATCLRNGREITEEWRNLFISAANERARYVDPTTTSSYRIEESVYDDLSNIPGIGDLG